MSVHVVAWTSKLLRVQSRGDFTQAATILHITGTRDQTGLVFSHDLSSADSLCLAHIFLQN